MLGRRQLEIYKIQDHHLILCNELALFALFIPKDFENCTLVVKQTAAKGYKLRN